MSGQSLLEGKKILITGGSHGIGEAIALEYAKQKGIIILCSRNLELLQKVCSKCKELGAPTADAFKVDLSLPNEVQAFGDMLLQKYEGVDVLVNNAGVFVKGTTLHGDPNEWDYMFNVNVLSPMRLMRCLTPKMVERGSGVVINICSIAALEPMKSVNAYAASKYALRGFSLSAYETLRDHNIKVMSINPAFVDTPMVAGRPGLDYKRMIQTTDIAEVALLPFRCSANCCPHDVTIRLTLPASTP